MHLAPLSCRLNITLFFGLCAYYAYFVVVEPIKVFQGIGKSFS